MDTPPIPHHPSAQPKPAGMSRSSSSSNPVSLPSSRLTASSGVPFKWEQQPGVPKPSTPLVVKYMPRNLLPLPPPAAPQLGSSRRGSPIWKKEWKGGRSTDPFVAALVECSKPETCWRSGKMWRVDLYGSCKNSCSVLKCQIPISRSRRPEYDLLSRRRAMTTTSTIVESSNIAQLISIKLDRTNYVLWLAQFLPVLRSNDLLGFVHGTRTCPTKHVKRVLDEQLTKKISHAYLEWHQQDQLILSWINASLTPSVLSTVAHLTTSRSVWVSLEKRYASQYSHPRIMQLKNQLQTTKQGNLSMSDYLNKMNHIANNLALVGKPVDDGDLIAIILNGIGPSYEAVVASVQAQDSPIYLDDLVGLLLSAELRQAEWSASIVSRATRQSPRLTCQICGRMGHVALNCCDWMNYANQGGVPPKKFVSMLSKICEKVEGEQEGKSENGVHPAGSISFTKPPSIKH